MGIRFPNIDHEPLTIATEASPAKVKSTEKRIVQGLSNPHILIPYKVNGEVQDTCYLYYSEEMLDENKLSWLEDNHTTAAVPLSDLSTYSQQQSFSGDTVFNIPMVESGLPASANINMRVDTGIAAVHTPPASQTLTLSYLVCQATDQSNDFFMLRNEKQKWSQICYFRQASPNEDGLLEFKFHSWPKEVTTVDILRGATASLGKGHQQLVPLRLNVSLQDLLSENQ